MNLPKKIVSLPLRLLALGLLLFFLVPPVLKAVHGYEFHAVQKDCERSTTHLHSSSLHNDALDYYFQVLAESNFDSYQLEEPLFFHQKLEGYSIPTYNSKFHFFSTRGPPYFRF